MTDNRIFLPNQPIQPVKGTGFPARPQPQRGPAGQGADFGAVLQREIKAVKFSSHAQQRLESRNIRLDEADLAKLQGAVDKAARKGARESLILMNSDLAFVVSVRNRTVITAVDGANLKENVFTNIDSAVIV